jgi:hypothetical protein
MLNLSDFRGITIVPNRCDLRKSGERITAIAKRLRFNTLLSVVSGQLLGSGELPTAHLPTAH